MALDPNNYASLEPLDAEELIEKLAEFQRNADAAEADWEDMKAETKEAKEKYEGWREKVATIGRARESAHPLYLLNDGNLTEEKPDEDGSLPLGEPEDDAPVVDLDDDAGTPEEVVEPPAPAKRIYPAEQDGQVYQGKTSQGNTCTVKQQAGGWYGRVSGKPIAVKQDLAAKAMRLVDEHTDEQIEWNPTVSLDVPEDEAPKPDPDPEDEEDLTGGV